jgi:uncharacterized protein YeaO (DUF488 family)
MFKLKRAYQAAAPEDGYRVLVERLWPRGITRQRAALDLWLKDIAPSPELRKWFDHDPPKWVEFQTRYAEELSHKQDLLDQLRQKEREGIVTLVYGAHDEQHNAAVALKSFLSQQ